MSKYFAAQSQIKVEQEPVLPVITNFVTSKLSDVSVCDLMVYNILSTLDADKASGPDGIGNMILKHCAESLCVPIAIVAEKSFSCGSFPSRWNLQTLSLS